MKREPFRTVQRSTGTPSVSRRAIKAVVRVTQRSMSKQLEEQIRQWAPLFVDSICLNDLDGAKQRAMESVRTFVTIAVRTDREMRRARKR